MDEHRFDDLARTLTQRNSRRAALTTLVGGALGLALTRITAQEAAAQPAAARCLRNGDPCARNHQCCSGECHHDHCRRDRRDN